MRLALIGFGQAGGKIVDRFVEYDRRTGAGIVGSAIAVNSARVDLRGLDNIPEEDRVLIGQSRVKGQGVGADNELGAEVAEADIDEIQNAIDRVPVHEIDAFLIVAGMGGGTGSGGSPVLAKHLKRIYTEPVYGLGVLPADDEGGIYTLNAARSFRTFLREVDNLLVFDNDAWRETGESLADGYAELNREIVTRMGVLFGAGEIDDKDEIGESVVDASEVINTLDDGGITTIGYASEPVDRDGSSSLLGRFGSSDESANATETTNRVSSLVRKATLGRLTLPCDVNGAQRCLLVASGPPEHLSRKGVERGRRWLEDETGSMEVRGGDYPLPGSNQVAAAVILSGVTDVPRVKELQQVAIEAQDNIAEIREQNDDELDNLLADEQELSPLF